MGEKLGNQLMLGTQPVAAGTRVDIFGPCAAQDSDQIIECGIATGDLRDHLHAMMDDVPAVIGMRASEWKPRTQRREKSTGEDVFLGIGREVHRSLAFVARNQRLLIATEVENGDSLRVLAEYTAAQNDLLQDMYGAHTPLINVLGWVGSRNTHQSVLYDIGKAASGYDHVSLMHKNPMYVGADEWEGLFDHLTASGFPVDRTLLCFRGYRGLPGYPNEYGDRNLVVDYEIPMLVSERLQRPVLIDASHIGGRVENVVRVLQESREYNFRGAIVEATTKEQLPRVLTDQKQHLIYGEQLTSLMIEDYCQRKITV